MCRAAPRDESMNRVKLARLAAAALIAIIRRLLLSFSLCSACCPRRILSNAVEYISLSLSDIGSDPGRQPKAISLETGSEVPGGGGAAGNPATVCESTVLPSPRHGSAFVGAGGFLVNSAERIGTKKANCVVLFGAKERTFSFHHRALREVVSSFLAGRRGGGGAGSGSMGSEAALPAWASKPCIMGIDEAGRGPVLGPMVYGCLYCARSYQKTLSTLNFADSKTLKEEKREELFENLKANESIGWAVDVIDPRELSSKMLRKNKINLNVISHDSAMGLVSRVLNMGVLLTEVYVDTVGDAEKYRVKLSERFPGVKFVVAKKADSLYPVVSGASIVAKVTRDRALRGWVLEETAENMHKEFGSGYPGDPETKAWLEQHKHSVFGFPSLVRFSWGTCTAYYKDFVEVAWESDQVDEDDFDGSSGKRQVKLSSLGFTSKRKIEETESSGRGRCKFFQSRKLQQVTHF
ncbi:hypothetical protein EUGRSUZ_G02689 [Eucalyptus grandis]|uniref:Ribonuclease n=5 Tax=Eucalyptus TaxID=3932 RepID=A0A059BHP0_EUCGR|nr:hypothetical protein EUGRSUZ_G02689 [Eucalyptus grandis]KAK3422142.1 hypothetical protein EUGRSUZ_G02689 [Eucalyptus grandis]KAK3422143.1 hypothetical protein EUGRSUZ_G02689 [Eucalyptus grandis]